MVGLQSLDLPIGVRVPVSQLLLFSVFYFVSLFCFHNSTSSFASNNY